MEACTTEVSLPLKVIKTKVLCAEHTATEHVKLFSEDAVKKGTCVRCFMPGKELHTGAKVSLDAGPRCTELHSSSLYKAPRQLRQAD